MTPPELPARFYAAATGMGVAFACLAVAVPLQVVALGGSAALAGGILALGTVAVALGAIAAGLVSARIGGGPRTLALSLVVAAAGSLVLTATSSIVGIAAAAVIVGAGVGIFWVASQLVLGRRSGGPDSERGFLVHYATYTFGAVVGSSATGGITALAEHVGLATSTGVRLGAGVGVAATVVAVLLWQPCARRPEQVIQVARLRVGPAHHLRVQLPDLLLVGALALLLPLAPVVLARGYHFGPLAIGLVMGSVSLSKIAGTVAARRLSQASGQSRTLLLLLAGGASFCLLLCIALTASVFVAALLATALAATGAWPLVVDSAQARVRPESRHGLTVVWNAREYGVIAAATATSGWLFGTFGTPTPLFALAAALLAGAAACSAAVLRRPVWAPEHELGRAVATSVGRAA